MSSTNGNGGRAKSLAAKLKQKAKEARRAVALPIPGVPGQPDFVFECVLRRIDVLTLIRNAQLPEHLAARMMGVKAKSDAEAQAEGARLAGELTLDDLASITRMQEDIALAVCVEPKLCRGAAPDDETVSLDELDFAPQLIATLFNYATSLSPDVPVATLDGGETSLTAVATFPDGAQREPVIDAGFSGAQPV